MNDEQQLRFLLGSNIRRYRNRLGLSQLNFALDMGISPTFLSAVESGKKWVSPQTLLKLAKVLNVEVYELFKPEENIPNNDLERILHSLDDASNAIKITVENSITRVFENIKGQFRG